MAIIDNIEKLHKKARPHQKADFTGQCFCFNVYCRFRLGIHLEDYLGEKLKKTAKFPRLFPFFWHY